MKNNPSFTKLYIIPALIITLVFACSNGEKEKINGVKPVPSEQTYKPWAYCWWMGNSVTKTGITENLEAYKKAGLGGIHIIPIYGEKGDENNFIKYLSPEWMEILHHTVTQAEKLGLGIDMSMGTGWPFGGPDITYDNSAKTFYLKTINLDTTRKIGEIINKEKGEKLICLTAKNKRGTYKNILDIVLGEEGNIKTNSYDTSIALIMKPTRQKVKRAAPGGEGLVLDYFNKEALNTYFRKFQEAFNKTAFDTGKVRAFYNDSYEVYGANFTNNFLEKFKELRDYDLAEYFNVLIDTTPSETKERILTDYCETISDLIYSGFTKTWNQKSHELGMITRDQAHGSPGNLLDLYNAVDIPETESFGVSNFTIPGLKQDPDFEEERFGRPNPLTMKFASSAAHISNKPLVSSETGTWLGDHFKVALSQVKPQVDELFVAGINHIFFHGITYNPPEKPFPGRLFYASTNFGTKSHFWNELPALNKYIERCQKVLQNTKSDNDILIYFPIYDIWGKKPSKEIIHRLDVHHSKKWMEESHFGEITAELWKDGFTFDYLSDKMLSEAVTQNGKIQFEGGTYKTIVVPKCTYMPEKTLEKLKNLATKGATIIFQEELPKTVSGYSNLEIRKASFEKIKAGIEPLVKITANITNALVSSGVANESMASQGLSFIRKTKDGQIIYFITNLSNRFYGGSVRLSNHAKNVLRLDPLTGNEGVLYTVMDNGRTKLDLQLQPGESCILTCSNQELGVNQWKNYTITEEPIILDAEWTIKPITENKQPPKEIKTKQLKSWTEFSDAWSVYSGKAMYTCEFKIEEKYVGKKMLLELGDVRETAKISLNGKNMGLLWCIPYKTIIPENTLEANNKLEIEVTNLSFNKVIELDREGVEWKNFHEINFVNIKYENYDASNKQPVKSGLLTKLTLYPVQ